MKKVRLTTAAQRLGAIKGGLKQTSIPKMQVFRDMGSFAAPLRRARAKFRRSARGF